MAINAGLLGGSFDPVHLAHIALARAARQFLELDYVELLPAANPWQRAPLSASGAHRLAMLTIALHNEPGLQVNTLELERGGPSYTIDTLRELPSGPDYYWILGADQLENFCSWRSWRDIAVLARLAVAQRPGSILQAPAALSKHLADIDRPLIHLPFEPTAISATTIRHNLATGMSTAGMLDVAVAQYIQQNGLYHPPAA